MRDLNRYIFSLPIVFLTSAFIPNHVYSDGLIPEEPRIFDEACKVKSTVNKFFSGDNFFVFSPNPYDYADTDDTLIAVIDKRFGLGVLIEPTDLFVEGLVTYVNFTLEEAPAHSCFVTFSMFDEAKSQAE